MKIAKEKIKTNKKYIWIIGIFIFVALGFGGYYGYKLYKFRQTPQYAMEKLRTALNPPDSRELADLIDFVSTSQDLANAIAKTFPFYLAGKNQERDIRNALQNAFLLALGDNSKARYEKDVNEAKDLQKPIIILPDDFAEQLVKNMSVRQTGADTAILTSKIYNPQLGHNIAVIFSMKKSEKGWIVKNFLNATEITQQIRQDLLQRHARLREVYEEKNDNTRKKMDTLLPILSCTADGGLLSDGKQYILMVHVLARNKGDLQVNNFTVDVTINGKNGSPIETRLLNAAKPVAPGEDFSYRWSFELDSQKDLAQELMAQTPLTCVASWQTMGVSNAQVWHIEEIPHQNRACLIDGHSHPEGFCIMPIFMP